MHHGIDHRIQITARQDRLAELAPPRSRRRLPARPLSAFARQARAVVARWVDARPTRRARRAPVAATPCLTVTSHSRGSR